MDNYFNQLNQINVNDKTEKKGSLTYLSWAWEICGVLTLVREDRVGRASGVPVVPPGAPPGTQARIG